MTIRLSVIVPTFQQADKLAMCLNALQRQTLDHSNYEIIVVDDGSGDITASVTDRYASAAARVRFIQHSTNKGAAAARHTGALAANGDLFLFLDSDLMADENYLKIHVNMHDSCPKEKLMVVGDVFYNQESMANSNFSRFMNSRYLGQRSEKATRRIDLTNLPAKLCGGGIISLPRSTYFAAGGFDLRFQTYGAEDFEFADRVLSGGARAVFAKGARVEHFDDADAKRIRMKHTEMGRETVKLCKKKDGQFLNSSNYRYLMPLDLGQCSVTTTIIRALIHLVLNKPNRFLINFWCLKTDTFAALYFSPIYRLALVSWFIDGTQEKILGVSKVYS